MKEHWLPILLFIIIGIVIGSEGLQNHFLPTHGGNLFTQPYLGRCTLVN